MWVYNSSGIDRNTGEEFVFETPVTEIPKWSKKNHSLFTKKFKNICLTLLCIQKRYKYIDKNIFLLFIEKLAYGNKYIIDFNETPFNIFLRVMKRSEEDTRSIYRKIQYSDLTYSTGFGITDTRITNINEENYRKGVISIESKGKQLNYSILKENSLFEISIGLTFNIFKEKEKRTRLYQQLRKTYTVISSEKEMHISNRFLFVALFIILLAYLICKL